MGGADRLSASNHTPPIPTRQASQAPVSEGDTGTSSRRRVGRSASESTKNRKSEMASNT